MSGEGGDLLQTNPGVDQVLAERVTKGMGGEIVESSLGSVSGQERLDPSRRQWTALALQDHGLLAGMLWITQGGQGGPGILIERHLPVLTPLALADRQQALALGEGDVSPRQVAE